MICSPYSVTQPQRILQGAVGPTDLTQWRVGRLLIKVGIVELCDYARA